MKTEKIFVTISLVGVLVACSDQSSGTPEPSSPIITITHFSDLNYTNNIIVTNYEELNQFLLMRGNECMRNPNTGDKYEEWPYDVPATIRSPYIELADGWYLIDWSWNGYPYDGNIILTDITWENYDGSFYFEKSHKYIENSKNNIYHSMHIRLANLMVYTYPDSQYPKYHFNASECHNFEENEEHNEFMMITHLRHSTPCLCEDLSDMYDKMWELLREQLIKVIQNNDLDNLPSANTQQLAELHEVL